MSGKNINFDDKKIKRSSFYKNKKINNIKDIDVNNILVSKKEPYRTKILTNTLSDTMIMIILDDYAYGFHKCQDMLENLMKMQQYLL